MAGAALAVLLLSCMAVQASAADLAQPASVTQTAFDFDNYLYFAPQNGASESPSDRPLPKPQPGPPAGAAPSAPAAAPTPDGTGNCYTCPPCDDCCSKSRWCRCGELGDPWTLPQPCALQNLGINVAGWMQAGVITNSHGASNNGPLGFNSRRDFNLHQLYLYAEKKTCTDDKDWDLGGRVDYVFGVDGPDTQTFGDRGFDFGWNSSEDFLGRPIYGSAVPQLYLELAFGNWTIKGGHFYSPIGYETIPAVGNFFFSHSYTHYYGEPFTHTGFIATYKVNDQISGFGGWVDGWDSGFNNRNKADNFLGGVAFTFSERTSLAWVLTAGNWGSGAAFAGANQGDIYMNSLVITFKITEQWKYILQHDLGTNYNNPGGDAEWYGINQYLLYQLNDCWAFGGRFEWFRDDDGARVIAGNAGDYYEVSFGANWKPHANVLVRPEIRWDWYEGLVGGGRPFNDGNSDSQFSGGFDVIVTF